MSGDKPEELYIGEKVLLKGTGKWWSGALCRATIVDIRTTDRTVKVQYVSDGGYKRMKLDEFNTIKVSHDYGDEGLAFGTMNFEWTDDVLSSMVGEIENEVTALRDQLKQAVLKRDFMKADQLKKDIQLKQKELDEQQVEQRALMQAIAKEDFIEADAIQKRIDAVRKASSKSASATAVEAPPLSETLSKALKRAFGGGIAGAAAMVVQVTSLMWIRTTMNYQYRYGTGLRETMSVLWKEGGVPRFYRGIVPALAQGPLSRFGDTAANAGALTLLDSYDSTRNLPVAVKTVAASAAAASWRIFLTPLDTVKTIMQVEGADGLAKLRAKVKVSGPIVFYHGALGASAATFAGHYPWFATYNTLDAKIPVPQELPYKLARNASIGFCASAVSDTVSNSLRVLKTYRQTSTEAISYSDAAREIVKTDGLTGLFGRGLKTRILANGMQGMMFSVMWKYFDSLIKGRS
eukprot:TRINITY_DN33686_c0_g1_i1.p1 TRINITY_DN33686_c0_g1~~TRINITY_DN33686_c0_g1_i1.p1  ORF type:complete len:484 (+),score=136.99 TRINITY_DN33686_c0_g1_i1:66-1454(+)